MSSCYLFVWWVTFFINPPMVKTIILIFFWSFFCRCQLPTGGTQEQQHWTAVNRCKTGHSKSSARRSKTTKESHRSQDHLPLKTTGAAFWHGFLGEVAFKSTSLLMRENQKQVCDPDSDFTWAAPPLLLAFAATKDWNPSDPANTGIGIWNIEQPGVPLGRRCIRLSQCQDETIKYLISDPPKQKSI